jgi:predicted PP-loop superfamily ATPase
LIKYELGEAKNVVNDQTHLPFNFESSICETSFLKCGLCINYYQVTVTYKPKEIITMYRCFWEELPTGVSIYKNDEIIKHLSVTSSNSFLWILASYEQYNRKRINILKYSN